MIQVACAMFLEWECADFFFYKCLVAVIMG